MDIGTLEKLPYLLEDAMRSFIEIIKMFKYMHEYTSKTYAKIT